jgi:hypothetical protein
MCFNLIEVKINFSRRYCLAEQLGWTQGLLKRFKRLDRTSELLNKDKEGKSPASKRLPGDKSGSMKQGFNF